MIRVLMFIDTLRCGGKERRLVELLRGLRSYPNIKCELILMNRDVYYSEIFDLGIKIHILERKVKKDPQIFFRLFRICRDFKPDIIHTWGGMEAVYIAPIAKIMKIRMINGMITHATPRMKASKAYRYAKLSFPFSDVVVSNSFAGLNIFNAPEKKRCCIQNGFDFARIANLKEPEAIKKEFQITTSKVVGMVGALEQRRKDYNTFISAAEILLSEDKDITFLLVGQGESLEQYTERIRSEHKDHIKLLGNQKAVESVINVFDVGVLATFYEGFSNVIMEYMALGKPVVVTDTGGNPEIVDDGKTGYLIPKSDPVQLANKIRHLLTNQEVAAAMAEAGQRRIREYFSLEKMVEKYDRLYEIVFNKKWRNIDQELRNLSCDGKSLQAESDHEEETVYKHRKPFIRTILRNGVAFVIRILGIPLLVREFVLKKKVTIVVYHDPDPETFNKHMAFLSRTYNFLPLKDLVQAIQNKDWSNIPDKGMVITFDDGIKRNYKLLDTFKEYKIRPTIYLCSHVIGTYRKFWFGAGFKNHRYLKKFENSRRLKVLKSMIDYEPQKEYRNRQALSLDEIREMSPYVDFQSHSRFHPILPNCTDDECREEIAGSKTELEKILDKSIDHFCYPNGDFSVREIEFVKNAGYLSSRSIDIGWNDIHTHPYKLKAFYIDDDASINILKAQTVGVLGYLRYLRLGQFNGKHPPYV